MLIEIEYLVSNKIFFIPFYDELLCEGRGASQKACCNVEDQILFFSFYSVVVVTGEVLILFIIPLYGDGEKLWNVAFG